MKSMIKLKLWPLLKRYRRFVLAISLMIAVGVMLMVSMMNAYMSFLRSVNVYFDSYGLPELTVTTEPFYLSDTTVLEADRTEYRLVVDCPVTTAAGRVITGRCFFETNEALAYRYAALRCVPRSKTLVNVGVDQCLANNSGIKPGDVLRLDTAFGVLDAYVYALMTTPENFVISRDAFNSFDNTDFGFLYFDYGEAAPYMNLSMQTENKTKPLLTLLQEKIGLFPPPPYNQILVYTNGDTDVLLRTIQNDFQVLSSHTRENSPQQTVADANSKPMRMMSVVLSSLVFAITIIVSWLFMEQIIQEQRQEIGLYRALGYPVKSITALFSAFGLVISIFAVAAGFIGAHFVSELLANQYFDSYLMPVRVYVRQPWLYIASAMIVLLLGQVPTVAGAAKIARIEPTEAMRSSPPQTEPPHALSLRLTKLPVLLLAQIRFAWRNRRRTFTMIGSIALTGIILCLATAYAYALDTIARRTISTRYRYDAMIRLEDMQSAEELRARFADNEQVKACEAAGYDEAVIAFNGVKKEAVIFAAEPGSKMICLENRDGIYIPIPPHGIVLEYHIARDLGVKAGDTVRVDDVPIEVRAVCYQDIRYAQYLSIAQMEALRGTRAASCALVSMTSPAQENALAHSVSGMDGFAYITFTRTVQAGIRAFADSSRVAVVILLLSGFSIGLLIIYNVAMINYNEHKRDFCTLMVQGVRSFSIVLSECAKLLIEYFISMLLSAAVCIPLVNQLLALLEVEVMSFRNTRPVASFLLNALLVFIYMALANGMALIKIRRVDLADSLKERE